MKHSPAAPLDPIARPIRFAVVGMGGYAKSIADRFLSDEERGLAPVELVASCDPALSSMPERADALRGASVTLLESFDALLAMPGIDAVWLPVPIALHRPFTEKTLAAGKHVVCEKPAAGTVQDIDAMIRARDASGLACLIGFQDVYNPAMQDLKRQIVSGQFGRPVHASVLGCRPRDLDYFGRNNWAGRIRVGDTWVLDSPANNAMAHPLHLALYLLGPAERMPARACAVRAELYRANAIENFDTCTIDVTLDTGVPLVVALTHACRQVVGPDITITTDRTVIRVNYGGQVSYTLDGREHSVPGVSGAWPVFAGVARSLRGDQDAPVGTLEMARAHTALINAISAAAPIISIPSSSTRKTPDNFIVIDGIEAALEACARHRQSLDDRGGYPWTRPGRQLACEDLKTFTGPFNGA